MALQAVVDQKDVHHIILQQAREGVYVFVFERADSPFAEWDYLQDDWEHAKAFSRDRYGVGIRFGGKSPTK